MDTTIVVDVLDDMDIPLKKERQPEGVDLFNYTILHNLTKVKDEASSTQGYCDSHKAV